MVCWNTSSRDALSSSYVKANTSLYSLTKFIKSFLFFQMSLFQFLPILGFYMIQYWFLYNLQVSLNQYYFSYHHVCQKSAQAQQSPEVLDYQSEHLLPDTLYPLPESWLEVGKFIYIMKKFQNLFITLENLPMFHVVWNRWSKVYL